MSKMQTKLLSTLFICISTSFIGMSMHPDELVHLKFDGHLSFNPTDLKIASSDFGLMKHSTPLAVLFPANTKDIARLVKAAYNSADGFTVSARGNGHSINGQAQTHANGVVVEMARRWLKDAEPPRPEVSREDMYVDVWGGELWIDVLKSTLEYGLAPKSWTDYLYLSVGGTLSNGGVGGQAFNHGPQISNVFELDVVTGKGEIWTCSETENSELFHAVLGGLGQFGIITRARIALEKAPQRVRWIQLLYSNFSTFTRDQEYLISLHGNPASDKFDYVEGFVTMNEGNFIQGKGDILYCLEVTKNYNELNVHTVDQEIESLLRKLNFIPSSMDVRDIPYVEFLDRVHISETEQRSKGLWDIPHPWLILFVPKSRIANFDRAVFKGISANSISNGRTLVYPLNKNKWAQRFSVVTPDEDIFYLVGYLISAVHDGDEKKTLEYLKNQNQEILRYCDDAVMGAKQYLPFYTTQEGWMDHFGDKWDHFYRMKMEFDPRYILATGQHIFKPSLRPSSLSISTW